MSNQKCVGLVYLAAKTSNGRTYYQLVKSVRVNGKPTHRVVCYLGKHKSAEAALEASYQDLEAVYTSPFHNKLMVAEAAVRKDEDRIKMQYAKALNKWHDGKIPTREDLEAMRRGFAAMALRRTFAGDARVEELCTLLEGDLSHFVPSEADVSELLASRSDEYYFDWKEGDPILNIGEGGDPILSIGEKGGPISNIDIDVVELDEHYHDWEEGDPISNIAQFLNKDLPVLEAKRKQACALTEAFKEKRAKTERRIEKLKNVVTKLADNRNSPY